MTGTTHYDVLGVPRDADPAAVRKAYLRASLRSHPDKNPGREAAAQAEFVRVGQAYRALGDPARRAAYDRELRARGTPGGRRRAGASATTGPTTGATTDATTFEFRADGASFQDFADLFDETVASMSEAEVNMASELAPSRGRTFVFTPSRESQNVGIDHPQNQCYNQVLGDRTKSRASSLEWRG